jgi:homocitrate synthase NifV
MNLSNINIKKESPDRKICLLDTTLRDGEQAPGVVFGMEDKLTIARMLDDIGIDEVEVGSPFISADEAVRVKKIVQSDVHFRSSCWSRALKKDIDISASTGAGGVNISFPVSDILLSAMGKNRDWVMKSLYELVWYAQEKFDYVSVGAQDAGRADADFLKQFIVMAAKLNVYRLRIADTVGSLNPGQVYQMVQNAVLSAGVKMTIGFHGHNDLGMATANTITAAIAGATWLDVTVNGLGERAGNAPLEEVIMALKHSTPYAIPWKTEALFGICSYVADVTGKSIHDLKPITGKLVFSHESGIHTHCIIKDKKTYQLMNGNEIGRSEGGFVFGLHTGTTAVKHYFKSIGIELTDFETDMITQTIKTKSYSLKRNLSKAEVLNIFRFELLQSTKGTAKKLNFNGIR